jgi:crotonobetainyl-CoA:carnitine CoA-transferase CaiB-like acyl-CoA transferase
MLEALVSADSITFASVLNGGPEHGNPRPGLLVHEIGGRHFALQTVGAPQLWPRILGLMGRPELAADPRFATSDLRRRNAGAARAIVEAWLDATFKTADEALAALAEARIPCAPVLRPHELIAEEHLAVRQFFPSISHPTHGAVRVTASPYHIDGEPVHPRGPAAYELGQHTRAVLGELLRYDTARIDALLAAGVLAAP